MKGLILHNDPTVRKLLKEHFPEFVFSDHMPEDDGLWDILIRWGNADGADRARVVLNRQQAVSNASSTAGMLGLLRLNGIKTQKGLRRGPEGPVVGLAINPTALKRRYRAYIFDLHVLALYRKRGRQYRRIAADLDSEVIEKVKSTATRTAYTLGLHTAMVEVGLINNWKSVVISVDCAPRLTKNLADLYASAIRTHLSKQGAISADSLLPTLFRQEIVLGADPEFMLRNRQTGRMVPASRLFPKAGPVGCDDRATRGTVRTYPLAEVRPQPTSSPIELIRNIRACLRRACTFATPKELRATRWEAGSMPFRGYPIGGHVHFSNVELSSDLLRALDNYLAIPTMLIERNATAVLRRRKYGHLGDHRVKEHGGFEYRTLGSWLMSPTIATAVLCLSKLVATEYRNLPSNWLDTHAAQRAFYLCDKVYFQNLFPSLWREVTLTPTYSHYAEELKVLRDLVEENKRWKESVDIKKTWELV